MIVGDFHERIHEQLIGFRVVLVLRVNDVDEG
jgi:hypothetical protein